MQNVSSPLVPDAWERFTAPLIMAANFDSNIKKRIQRPLRGGRGRVAFAGLTCVCCVQVEQLFCLGLSSRAECLKLLEMCEWNLEVASTQMLDNYGSVARQRYRSH